MPAHQPLSRRASRWLLAAAMLLALVGCATRSQDIQPRRTPVENFSYWDCERLHDESDRVQQRAADLAYAVDARAGNNALAMSLGLTVFWPALMAMRPDGLEAQELAELKGRHEAIVQALAQRACPPPPQLMDSRRAARLPVVAGERLVYEERLGQGLRTHTRELGLRLTALRRDQLEFALDLDGRPADSPWRQDLAGNVIAAPVVAGLPAGQVLNWRRLLRGPLELGQVLSGELHGPDLSSVPARLRGQVVAEGLQRVAGRDFDAAVIELFGEVPVDVDGASVRLDGAMAVDRASGVLLRLDLRSNHPDYALRRRLQRVEAAASAPR